jgi:hypothetical protein
MVRPLPDNCFLVNQWHFSLCHCGKTNFGGGGFFCDNYLFVPSMGHHHKQEFSARRTDDAHVPDEPFLHCQILREVKSGQRSVGRCCDRSNLAFQTFSLFSIAMRIYRLECIPVEKLEGVVQSIYPHIPWMSMLPLALFYGIGLLFSGSLEGQSAFYFQGQAAFYFRPHLLFQPRFWRDWIDLGTFVLGQSMIIAGFLGFFFLNKIKTKILLLGLLAGYFLFGIVFTYNIITHSYYHIQVFPLLALSASAFVVLLAERLQLSSGRYWLLPAFGVFLILFYFNYQEIAVEPTPTSF